MKRKSIFNIFIITLLLSLVFSCSEIFDKAIVEKSREEATSKIVFDANGGTWESDGESVHTILGVIGKPLLLANAVDMPERAGYIFLEWKSENDDTAYSDYKSIEKVPEKDLRYTAQWQIDFVEVSFGTKRIAITEGDTNPITLNASWIPADATQEELAKTTINWSCDNTSDFTFTPPDTNGDKSKATLALKSSASIGAKTVITVTIDKSPTPLTAKCQIVVSESLEKIGEYKTKSSYSGSVSGGTYVTFGTFPQSVKGKDIEILGKKFDDWYGCYVTKEQGGQTYYLGSDGHWYVKAISNPYDGKNFNDNTTQITRENDDGDDMEYYFKVEPIVWRVVTSEYEDANGDKYKLLLAENILTADINLFAGANTRKLGSTTIYPTSWEYSNVRAYLNGTENAYTAEGGSGAYSDYSNKGFLQIAFTETQQKNEIKKIKVANDKSTTAANSDKNSSNATMYRPTSDDQYCTCRDTEDRIFVLSLNEITKENYKFDTVYGKADEAKKRLPTDYALVNNAPTVGQWWLRSPVPLGTQWYSEIGMAGGPNSMFIVKGNYNTTLNPSSKNIGIVPALCVAP